MATDPADHAVHPLCCCSQPSYLCDYEITGTVFVQVSTEMINFYDSVYDKGITQSVTTDKGKEQAAATVLKVFHETVLIFFFLSTGQLCLLTLSYSVCYVTEMLLMSCSFSFIVFSSFFHIC